MSETTKDFGYYWFCMRLWRRETAERVKWKIAWACPRWLALLCFVRVCSATGDSPSEITYESAYKAWEKGAGR